MSDVVVNVSRRNLKEDYFQKNSRGYYGESSPKSAEKHWETDTIQDLQSHSIAIEFKKEFTSPIPVTITFNLYRIIPKYGATNAYVKENVMFFYPVENFLTSAGFVITIEPFEDLNGVILDYGFTE